MSLYFILIETKKKIIINEFRILLPESSRQNRRRPLSSCNSLACFHDHGHVFRETFVFWTSFLALWLNVLKWKLETTRPERVCMPLGGIWLSDVLVPSICNWLYTQTELRTIHERQIKSLRFYVSVTRKNHQAQRFDVINNLFAHQIF